MRIWYMLGAVTVVVLGLFGLIYYSLRSVYQVFLDDDKDARL